MQPSARQTSQGVLLTPPLRGAHSPRPAPVSRPARSLSPRVPGLLVAATQIVGTHALAAAQLKAVDHVWMVELNGSNRRFVQHRAEALGLSHKLTCLRDLEAAELPKIFDSLTCLDVLEHLADPSAQLKCFAQRLKSQDGVALLNWYFFKGHHNEYPFHFDDPEMVNLFFSTLQDLYLERFHPHLITARTYALR